AKMLRALQERDIDRLGGTAPIRVDVRILAATHRDLQAEVAKGRFREDLYFRLAVVRLRIPALRERPADILPLARYFAERYAHANGLPQRPLGPEAETMLLSHPWPGNVRELENAIHRAVLLAEGSVIGPDAIELMTPTSAVAMAAPVTAAMPDMAPPPSPLPQAPAAMPAPASRGASVLVGRRMEEVERELILETLSHCLGNRTRAAEMLGISIRTLRNKLHEYRAAGVSVPPIPGQMPVTAVAD
ncbi:MAG: sigma-54-dependent Fis family transcriptional regulator, partial [Roseomonas sp.]|nr:sigma-54-dependent Fis family transcriptional regulator [Roseomonas sp.]